MPEKGSLNFTGPLSWIANSALGKKAAVPGDNGSKGPVKPTVNSIPLPILLWLGARLPFAAFVIMLGMFTYVYHIAPLLPWFFVFLSIDFGLVVCWPPAKIGTKRRSFSDWAPMMSWSLAIICAVVFGFINYGIIENWVNTAFLEEYEDAVQGTDALAVQDAGVLTFAQGTRLDTQSAAGYKFWFYNYCAAPIVGSDPKATPVTFWAVGVGCCKSRGDFTCDSAGDASARSGMPLRPYNIGPEITSHYNHAIRMSASTNDLEVAKEPVFVVWRKDPKQAGADAWWIATLTFLILIFVGMCACFGCQSGLQSIHMMKQ